MKNAFVKKLLTFMLVSVMILAAAACGSSSEPAETNAPAEESVASDETAAPAETGDAAEENAEAPAETEAEGEASTGGVTEDTPLVIGTNTLDGKFSEFFATSAYDRDVVGMTTLALLSSEKDGTVVANNEKPSYAESYTMEVNEDETETKYTFVLKNDVVFSDGTPVTVDDLLYSFYVYADPHYDGSSTFYSLNIKGMNEYRLQTSTEMIEVGNDILAAGISGEPGAAEPTLGEGLTVATPEQQAAFWGYLPEAGNTFAQEIIDYVAANYLIDDYVTEYFPGFTAAEIEASDSLKTAYGMTMWGFGSVEDKTFTDANGDTYDLSDAAVEINADNYWANIVGAYGYDLEGINGEAAGSKTIEDYVKELFFANEGSVEGGVASISGITTSKVTGEDGAEHDAVELILNGVDPTAIFKMGVNVSPKAYYSEGYEGELNEFGVNPTDRASIENMKTKNEAPLGAGPYIFESYADDVVTLTSNPNYIMGEPKIPTIRFQVLAGGSELDALKTGTVHFAEPDASQEIVSDISSGAGDFEKLDYILVDNDGYGYIGMNAQAIPEFNVRKAIAHAFNIEGAVENYYGELASVNNRTMTKVQWAYPANPEAMFPYDETGETSKQLFEEAGYVYDEASKELRYPEGHEKAGQQLTLKFTLPSDAQSHPAGQIFIDAQKLLGDLGVKVDIEVDPDLLGKLSTAYESGVQVWAAAWGSGGSDPDMFQIWHSDPAVNNVPSNTGLKWLFDNGSEEEKSMLVELNENIMAGRSILDPEERKPIYARALELSTGLAVEIPTYQRKNMFAYNKEVINGDTLFSGEDVTPFQDPHAEIWNVELNW